MTEWFHCKKCGRLSHVEFLTVNRCPFCGHDYLSEVILKDRDVSPTYTYHAKPNDLPMKTEWMPLPEAPKEGEG